MKGQLFETFDGNKNLYIRQMTQTWNMNYDLLTQISRSIELMQNFVCFMAILPCTLLRICSTIP